jgi:hypothetical protein
MFKNILRLESDLYFSMCSLLRLVIMWKILSDVRFKESGRDI